MLLGEPGRAAAAASSLCAAFSASFRSPPGCSFRCGLAGVLFRFNSLSGGSLFGLAGCFRSPPGLGLSHQLSLFLGTERGFLRGLPGSLLGLGAGAGFGLANFRRVP